MGKGRLLNRAIAEIFILTGANRELEIKLVAANNSNETLGSTLRQAQERAKRYAEKLKQYDELAESLRDMVPGNETDTYMRLEKACGLAAQYRQQVESLTATNNEFAQRIAALNEANAQLQEQVDGHAETQPPATTDTATQPEETQLAKFLQFVNHHDDHYINPSLRQGILCSIGKYGTGTGNAELNILVDAKDIEDFVELFKPEWSCASLRSTAKQGILTFKLKATAGRSNEVTVVMHSRDVDNNPYSTGYVSLPPQFLEVVANHVFDTLQHGDSK